jgi:hypothetical protein
MCDLQLSSGIYSITFCQLLISDNIEEQKALVTKSTITFII